MKILIYAVVFLIYSVLKPFVDDFLYNTFSATYGPGADTAALYCGLCAALFACSAYLCARWLCRTWDERRAAKDAAESPVPDQPAEQSPITEPDAELPNPDVPATTPAPTATRPKSRFCKLCGGPIDPVTRKCTGCRKQYFRPPVFRKKHLVVAASVIVCAAVVFLVLSLVSQLNTAQTQIAELNAQISELESKVSEQERQIGIYKNNEASYLSRISRNDTTILKLLEQNETYKEYLDYCEYYCAYIVPKSISGSNSDKYHRLDCPYAGDTEDLVILYIDFLESRGFKPCSYCYG